MTTAVVLSFELKHSSSSENIPYPYNLAVRKQYQYTDVIISLNS